MHKVRDYIHLFDGFELEDEDLGTCRRGVCRVRIYEHPGGLLAVDGDNAQLPVAIISELPDNPNVEVADVIEVLAAELCVAHALPTHATRFIAHYERTEVELDRGVPETYSRVEFLDRRLELESVDGQIRLSFGEPDFEHLGAELVCDLIGEPHAEVGHRSAFGTYANEMRG